MTPVSVHYWHIVQKDGFSQWWCLSLRPACFKCW